MILWHRLFGIALTDLFTGAPFTVELEKDLSLKQQRLDMVIIRKAEVQFEGKLPDGLENLVEHNLLSYKSMQEPFDDWVVDELIGHYVNYRKQVSPDLHNLLPKEMFRLYGVSTRFPQNLADVVPLLPLQEGVYQMIWGTHQIRLLVLSEMPETESNAIWNLFSSVPEKFTSGATQYRNRTTDMSSLINKLFEKYRLEGLIMPYTMEDFRREVAREYLETLTVDEVLQLLTTDDRLRGLSTDDRLRGLSLEQIRTYLEKLEKQREP